MAINWKAFFNPKYMINPSHGVKAIFGKHAAKDIKEFLAGKGEKFQRKEAMTPEQLKYLNKDIIGQLRGQPLSMEGEKGYKEGLKGLRGVIGEGYSSPEQNPLYGQGSNYIQNLLSQKPQSAQEEYEAYRKPMMREFNEEVVPDIAERFAGMGGTNSSGFQQTMGQAGQSLQERLGAMSMGLNRQREESLYGRQMQGLGLGEQYAMNPATLQSQRQMTGLAMTPGYVGSPYQQRAGYAGLGVGARPYEFNKQGAQPGFLNSGGLSGIADLLKLFM